LCWRKKKSYQIISLVLGELIEPYNSATEKSAAS